MSLAVLQDRRFHEFQLEIDRDLAVEVGRSRCWYCGAILHSACYSRRSMCPLC